MDIKDQNMNLASPGFMIPDTGAVPLEAELAVETETIPSASDTPPKQKKSATPLQESLRSLRRDKRAMLSLIVIVLFILIPLIGPFIYTHIGGSYTSSTGVIGPDKYHSPGYQVIENGDQNPSGLNWLGTDSIGRDLLARLMQGMLISLAVALAVEVINVVLGISIGTLAGFFGGWTDQLLARFTDIMFAFPGLLFVIMLSGILGSQADTFFQNIPLIGGGSGNTRLVIVSLGLAMTSWPLMARLARGQTLQLKQQQFVEAAFTSGTSKIRIMLRHIIPNLLSIIIITATLDIVTTIVGEAGLSFLGLGVQTPGSSIGLMINDASGLTETHPWEVLLPAIVLTLIVLAFSFLGDGLRDAFDPRSKD